MPIPKSPIVLSDHFSKQLNRLEKSRLKMYALFNNGHISKTHLKLIYENLFLSANIAFDNFLERLFVGLLVSSSYYKSSYQNVIPKIEVRSYKVANDILLGPNKKYISWTPFDRTLELAQIYFRGGRPFSLLNNSELNHLKRSHLIRNVIAHRSKHSINKFKKDVIGSTSIPQQEKKDIALYLMGVFRRTPNIQTRYEDLVANILLISRKLAK